MINGLIVLIYFIVSLVIKIIEKTFGTVFGASVDIGKIDSEVKKIKKLLEEV